MALSRFGGPRPAFGRIGIWAPSPPGCLRGVVPWFKGADRMYAVRHTRTLHAVSNAITAALVNLLQHSVASPIHLSPARLRSSTCLPTYVANFSHAHGSARLASKLVSTCSHQILRRLPALKRLERLLHVSSGTLSCQASPFRYSAIRSCYHASRRWICHLQQSRFRSQPSRYCRGYTKS